MSDDYTKGDDYKSDEGKEAVMLEFTVTEAARLVEILSFCKSSCQFLSKQEGIDGSDILVKKYHSLAEDSGLLAKYIVTSVAMGEPDNNKVH
jgi:hypothetical protein